MSYLGLVQLEATLAAPVLAQASSGAPVNLDALPTYRIYGPGGLMDNGSGSLAFKDSASITGASNTSPIVITSAAHGLTTGTRVTISGVTGNTAANGTFVVTYVSDSTFSLQGSTGNGGWVSGGTWNVTGLYTVSIDATSANGYEAGETYTLLTSGLISAVGWADLSTFTVV